MPIVWSRKRDRERSIDIVHLNHNYGVPLPCARGRVICLTRIEASPITCYAGSLFCYALMLFTVLDLAQDRMADSHLLQQACQRVL